jgi:hypothetical protein
LPATKIGLDSSPAEEKKKNGKKNEKNGVRKMGSAEKWGQTPFFRMDPVFPDATFQSGCRCLQDRATR